MASRKEQKERLRQERLEAQHREEASARRRLYAFYGLAAVLTAGVLAGLVIVLISGGGGGGSSGGSHIDPATGSTNGAAGDDRQGTTPPKVADASLKSAADKAGCDLR